MGGGFGYVGGAGGGGGATALHSVFYNHMTACGVHCCTRQTKRFQDTLQ